MKIVFDVFVDGKVRETLQPNTQRLKEIQTFIKAESATIIKKYGTNVYLNRRFIYN